MKTNKTQRQKGKYSPYAIVTQANTKIQTGLKKKNQTHKQRKHIKANKSVFDAFQQKKTSL